MNVRPHTMHEQNDVVHKLCVYLQFKENEEKFEKKVQEQLSSTADAATSSASKAVDTVKNALPNDVKGKASDALDSAKNALPSDVKGKASDSVNSAKNALPGL